MKRLYTGLFIFIAAVCLAGGVQYGYDALRKDLNLSDLNNTATARTSLGIANHDKIAVDSSGNASFTGYTALGADAPKVKFKKLTDTFPSSYNYLTIALPCSGTKVISFTAQVATGGQVWPHSIDSVVGSYTFPCYIDGDNLVSLFKNDTSSDGLAGGVFTGFITYEE